jgi:hypothetical protein
MPELLGVSKDRICDRGGTEFEVHMKGDMKVETLVAQIWAVKSDGSNRVSKKGTQWARGVDGIVLLILKVRRCLRKFGESQPSVY